MRIGIVGSGRVAKHIATALYNGQHTIVQVFSRQLEQAYAVAQTVAAQPIKQISDIDASLDVILLCVSDHAIADVAAQIAQHIMMQNKPQIASLLLPQVDSWPLLLHCSGSTDLAVLSQYYAHCGVMYPLQTFSFEKSVDWSSIPLLIETHLAEDGLSLQHLAATLSTRIYAYNSAQRLSLHLAAVFACNFSNACYDMAQQVSHAAQVDFALLYPLILETAQKATQFSPVQVQTGPARRADLHILHKHQQMLSNQPNLAQVYALLTRFIQTRHHTSK